jgi:microcompartment protein CcmL/EutN
MTAGFLEVQGFTAALCAVDSMCKAASVKITAIDANNTANDSEAVVPVSVQVKIEGSVGDVKAALEAGKAAALKGLPPEYVLTHCIPSIDTQARPLLKGGKLPPKGAEKKLPPGLGVTDIQFFPNAVIALDVMLNRAAVEIVSVKKYLGGRMVTIITGGSSSDVKAAVDAVRERFSSCKTLKNSAVITNPHRELSRFLN